jgi:cholesterol transport system auxiliary component
MRTLPLKALPAIALALALGGCISVFPKAKPVQLYSFGANVPAPAEPSAAPVTVLKGPTIFASAAGADRLLTVTGSERAYIGGARWVSPASVMFDDDVLKAFDAPGSPRLVERGEPLASASMLRLDVRTFEARYPGPMAIVQVRATLISNIDHHLIAEKMFDASVAASDNRQSPIVAAYDGAVSKVIGDIRAWTAANAPAK